MPSPINFQKFNPASLYDQEVANMQKKPVNKMTLFFKLALAFFMETFAVSSIKANLSFIYKKIRHQDNLEAKHVYEYSSKIFCLMKCSSFTEDQKGILRVIGEIKQNDQKKGDELEAAALKIFADPILRTSSSFHKISQDKIDDVLVESCSIKSNLLNSQAKRTENEQIRVAIFMFQTQIGEEVELNYKTLALFKTKTQGFPRIQEAVAILTDFLEQKIIDTYDRDKDRANFEFKIDPNFLIHKTDDGATILKKLKNYYQQHGKTADEASKLALICLFTTAQGGLAKAQKMVIFKLNSVFPNATPSCPKIEQIHKPVEQITINPDGFKVVEARPYEFLIVEQGQEIRIPFDLKVINDCDGKRLKTTFKNEKFIDPLSVFKQLKALDKQKALTSQQAQSLIKSCPILQDLTCINTVKTPEMSQIAFLMLEDTQIKDLYGFTEDQIANLRKDPTVFGKSSLTYADLNKLDVSKQSQAKQEFKRQALARFSEDIERTGLNATILGQTWQFKQGDRIEKAELEKFFQAVINSCGQGDEAVQKAYDVLFSLCQNLNNYALDNVLNPLVERLNTALELNEDSPLGSYLITPSAEAAVPLKLKITQDQWQIECDMPMAAKLPLTQMKYQDAFTLPIHVKAYLSLSSNGAQLKVRSV